jgi:hypothetical protein
MSVNVQMVEQLNQKAKTLNSDRQRMIGQQEAARTSFEKAVFAYKQKYGVQLDDTNIQPEYNAVSAQLQTDFDRLNTLVLSIESGEYKQTAAAMVIPASPVAQQVTVPVTPAPQPVPQPVAQPVQQQAFGAQPTSAPAPAPVATQQFGQQPAPVQQQFGQAPVATQQFGQQPAQTSEAAPTAPPSAQLSPADIAAATAAAMNQQPVAPVQPQTGAPVGQPAQFGQQQFGQPAQSTPVQPAQPAENAAVPQNNGDQPDVSEQAFTPTGWGQPDKSLNTTFETILGGTNGTKFGQQ